MHQNKQTKRTRTNKMALFRDLEVGETRKDLVRKVPQGLARRKWHTVTSTLEDQIGKVVGIVKTEQSAATEPPSSFGFRLAWDEIGWCEVRSPGGRQIQLGLSVVIRSFCFVGSLARPHLSWDVGD